MDRTDFSPFNASSRSWGTAQATDPHLVAEINLLKDALCNGGLSGGGGATSSSVVLFQDADEVRDYSGVSDRKLGYLLYITTPAGGGGGWFRYSSSSVLADDGADVFKPDSVDVSNSGRWLRIP